jgi:GTPase Era involved in 16S rRNA processing
MATRTVLLIGKTGNGKSTVGNVLAGAHVFAESAKAASETKHAQVHYVTIEGVQYKIVDTIGIGDTELTQEAVCMRIADACVECKDGINQVLFVTKDRFTKVSMRTPCFYCVLNARIIAGRDCRVSHDARRAAGA